MRALGGARGPAGACSPVALLGAITAGLGAAYLLVFSRGLLSELLRPASGGTVSWKREILAVSEETRGYPGSVDTSFLTSSPVLFYFHGMGRWRPGRMGMTWQVVNSLSMVAASWSATKAPRLGMLISQRRFEALDHLFRISTIQALGVSLLAG